MSNLAFMDADAEGDGVEEIDTLDKLNFSDLYIRLDMSSASRYTVGPNDKGMSGNYEVPAQYDGQIDMLRTMIDKIDRVEDTVTLDHMRLRFAKGPRLGQQWAALRRIPPELPVLTSLGMLPDAVKAIRAYSSRRGIVLVGGATGAGKTTTLVAAINDYLTSKGGVAVTIEDPPEFFMQGEIGKGMCFQFEVRKEEDWGDLRALALRWRPRYIMFGEIRTPEAAVAALRASTSGHLVLSTVHGGSVDETLGAVLRLAEIQMGNAARALLADNVVAVIHQQLGRRGPTLNIVETSRERGLSDEVRKGIAEAKLAGLQTHAKTYMAAGF